MGRDVEKFRRARELHFERMGFFFFLRVLWKSCVPHYFSLLWLSTDRPSASGQSLKGTDGCGGGGGTVVCTVLYVQYSRTPTCVVCT